jgi:hypothetical protein
MNRRSTIARPSALDINAWIGEGMPARSNMADNALGWALKQPDRPVPQYLQPPRLADPWDWRHPEVGWGIVLADNDEYSERERAHGADAPEPIQRLLAARPDAPILRYRDEGETRFTHLTRYYPDGPPQDIYIYGPDRGVGRGALPCFLLIYGHPVRVPWSLQFRLNLVAAVGRLTIEGQALEHYVDALLTDWDDSTAQTNHSLVWATDQDEMTRIMRLAVAERIHADLSGDNDLGGSAVYLDGSKHSASAAGLAHALIQHRPSLVVTTSHGRMGPLDDLSLMQNNLGLPVDQHYALLKPEQVLESWMPDGAIWYAHACCSAGSTAPSSFDGLLQPGSPIDQVLQVLSQLGPQVALLPTALLGVAKPLRAFIGHVEPTFDWTIREETGQALTRSIRQALYRRLYQPYAVGYALRGWYEDVGGLYGAWDDAEREFNRHPGGTAGEIAFRCKLAACDRRSLIILGDPAVALPPLRPQSAKSI